VEEPLPTRDHTENLLAQAGASVRRKPGSVTVSPVERLELGDVEIPGDFSSAAPFVVAATLLAGYELTIHGINLNPRRTGLLGVLERMGANVTVFNRRRIGGEPAGDLDVRPSEVVGATIGAGEVPLLVDELPLFALLAVHAHGDSALRGASELRAKESDRIEAVVDGLRSLGGHIRATPDGFTVRGVPSRIRGGGTFDSRGDPRIAILGAITGLVSREGVEVVGPEAAAVSFPGFYDLLDSLRA
jgi:3-phosphoshikimate 1-carboxyvinyltransferase